MEFFLAPNTALDQGRFRLNVHTVPLIALRAAGIPVQSNNRPVETSGYTGAFITTILIHRGP